jgi:UTP--glucose-1-phosphate uridylyltransferase
MIRQMVAIVTAAGKGTRMAAVSEKLPKELLPLGSKPVLLRVMEECRACDPTEIVVVSSESKTQLNEQIELWSQERFPDIPIRIAFQSTPNGVAGAIADADVESDATILLGDCLFAHPSPIPRLANLVERGVDACVLVEKVADEAVSRYGIVEIDESSGLIRRILEKPSLAETSSRWAVAGRYALSGPVMGFLRDYMQVHGNEGSEITLSEVFEAGLRQEQDIRAVPLQDGMERLDCGTPEEYKEAHRQRWD